MVAFMLIILVSARVLLFPCPALAEQESASWGQVKATALGGPAGKLVVSRMPAAGKVEEQYYFDTVNAAIKIYGLDISNPLYEYNDHSWGDQDFTLLYTHTKKKDKSICTIFSDNTGHSYIYGDRGFYDLELVSDDNGYVIGSWKGVLIEGGREAIVELTVANPTARVYYNTDYKHPGHIYAEQSGDYITIYWPEGIGFKGSDVLLLNVVSAGDTTYWYDRLKEKDILDVYVPVAWGGYTFQVKERGEYLVALSYEGKYKAGLSISIK